MEGICAFLGLPMKVADRHSVIGDVRDEFDVGLTIIDAEALAEGLAEPDLFPLAEHYLALPSELAPSHRPTTMVSHSGTWTR